MAEDICIDTLFKSIGESLGVDQCYDDLDKPGSNQYFRLTSDHSIRLNYKNSFCIDTHLMSLQQCNSTNHKQLWKYDLVAKTIKS